MEPKEEGAPPPKDSRRAWLDDATAQFRSANGLYVAAVSLLTAFAQAWVVIEQKWVISIVTLLLAAVCVTLYVTFGHRGVKDDASSALIRRTALGVLLLTPVLAAVWLYAYSALPRLKEDGNTLAVARFAGPPLPPPYDSCRPSAMLVHSLSPVAEQYHHFTVFELPYEIAPDGRWAKIWAQGHGSFEASDIIVYGEYTLHKSAAAGGDAKPDEIAITPRFESVPTVPLASEKSAPLQEWESPGSVVKIEQLCSGGLPEAGPPPVFLDDARRLALAIVGAKLFGAQDYAGGLAALRAAKAVSADRSCESASTQSSSCPGVLAFYLGNLDQRAGNYAAAEREYLRAADELPGAAAPLLDLGELYARMGREAAALREFDQAVQSEPDAVAPVATRALYERDYGAAERAAIDLDRAQHLRAGNAYDVIALSRALVQRSDGSGCGIKLMRDALARSDFDKGALIDAFVAYGVWQEGPAPEIATSVFRNALALDPYHVKANYRLGLMLRNQADGLAIELARESAAGKPASAAEAAQSDELRRQARTYFYRASDAPGFTDEEFLDKGSAAHELGDDDAALGFYDRSIAVNPNAAYAHHHRAQIFKARGQFAQAGLDFGIAANLLPHDALTVGDYAAFLSAHAKGTPEQRRWQSALQQIGATRFSPDEKATWSSATCRYDGLSYPGTD
ncbi:MAG: hypothetical protein ACLPYS_16190 [Vulcanimicrobiaceae bacterium]